MNNNSTNIRREISDIMEDFLNDFEQDGKRIVLGARAKAAVEEMVRDWAWRDERNAEYKTNIIEQAQELDIDTVTACVQDMLNKIVHAPTTLHLLSVPRLIMPTLLEFIKESDNDR